MGQGPGTFEGKSEAREGSRAGHLRGQGWSTCGTRASMFGDKSEVREGAMTGHERGQGQGT